MSHVECAVGINVMRVDAKKVRNLQNRIRLIPDRASGPARQNCKIDNYLSTFNKTSQAVITLNQ